MSIPTFRYFSNNDNMQLEVMKIPHTFATLLPCQRSSLRHGDFSDKVSPIVTSGKGVLVSAKKMKCSF